ncbi:unannotated protein [freshwater metagenome]|uniref:Unannotated protein n=1 Tax=freshwater metagenome TaxID=449393 RepID=A0A6J6RGF2_9ZZZZ
MNLNPDQRVPCCCRLDEQRGEPAGSGSDDANASSAGHLRPDRVHVGAEGTEFRVDPPGSFHHNSSLGGREAGGAIDEGRSEFFLKP